MSEVHVMTQDVLVACIILGLTALVGVLGNVMMLRALIQYKKLRIDFFILLGSVSAADMLYLTVAVPMNIIFLTVDSTTVTETWCKASKYIEAASGFVAAYHLVVLAVLRGILLTNRGRNPPTPCQTLICVTGLWVIAFMAAIPFPLTVEEVEGVCHYTLDTDIVKDVWLLNSFSCFVPMGLIVIIYLLTYLVGKRYFEDSYSYKEKQMSKLVTVVMAFFIVMQLPFRALDTHVMYKELEAGPMDFPDEDNLESLYIARNYLLCLMIADKAARPIIYSKLAPGLSEAFDEVVNCTVCQRVRQQHEAERGASPNNNNSIVNGAGSQKDSRRSKRYPSTSSNAPLTGGNGEDGTAPDMTLAEDELVEIVQL